MNAQIQTKEQLIQSQNQIQSLGTELNSSQDGFKIAVKATIQQAANIGRIAHEANERIQAMPTQHQVAKILKKQHGTISYKKYTFSSWVKEYTDLTKKTIYDMIDLYEALRNDPEYEPSEDMSWRKCLKHLTQSQKTEKQLHDEARESCSEEINNLHEQLQTKPKEVEKLVEVEKPGMVSKADFDRLKEENEALRALAEGQRTELETKDEQPSTPQPNAEMEALRQEMQQIREEVTKLREENKRLKATEQAKEKKVEKLESRNKELEETVKNAEATIKLRVSQEKAKHLNEISDNMPPIERSHRLMRGHLNNAVVNLSRFKTNAYDDLIEEDVTFLTNIITQCNEYTASFPE